MSMTATVEAVAADSGHNFSKPVRNSVTLIKGIGVEGDAHAGKTVQHLWDKARTPDAPNLRQVHLVHAELYDALAEEGFQVTAGQIGENILTRGVDLLGLPLATHLSFPSGAKLEVTGYRDPCKKLNAIQDGLIHKMIAKGEQGQRIVKSGIMSIVLEGGAISPGDPITVTLPNKPHKPLPIL